MPCGGPALLPHPAPAPIPSEPAGGAGGHCDKMCDFIHDSTESRVIGTPIPRIRVTRKRRPRDAKPTSQSVFATTLAK
jgi:uracil-DNA glycosylase